MTRIPPMPFSFTDEMIVRMDASVLCWLATADADGTPNVSPKEMFVRSGEDRIIIAQIASPVTVKNILANPNVCVSMVDLFVQKGWKFTGTARFVEMNDPAFAELKRMLESRFGTGYSKFIRSVFEMTVTAAEPIIAPSYRLVPGTTEEGQIAQALQRYGVHR